MYRGGYQIIDLKDVALTSGVAKTITGTYGRVRNNNRKAFLLCGLTVVISGTPTALDDCVLNFTESEGTYTATLPNGGTIALATGDTVTYTQA